MQYDQLPASLVLILLNHHAEKSSASKKAFASSLSDGTGNKSLRPAKQIRRSVPGLVLRFCPFLSKLAKIPLSLHKKLNFICK